MIHQVHAYLCKETYRGSLFLCNHVHYISGRDAGAVLVARAQAVRHGPYHAAMAIWSRAASRSGRGRRRGRTAAYRVARAAGAGVASGAAAANVADRHAPLRDAGPTLIALRRGRGRRRRDPGVAIGGARRGCDGSAARIAMYVTGNFAW
jgi:hypothetical protein